LSHAEYNTTLLVYFAEILAPSSLPVTDIELDVSDKTDARFLFGNSIGN